jgi:hypothetical protein
MDQVVAAVGIAMALVLVLRNGELRRLSAGRGWAMMLIWAVIIVAAALLFHGFRQ